MGLFSKKPSSDDDRKQQAANKPFVADDQIMARVAELMRMFNDAVGDPNPAISYATAKGISSLAGLTSGEQVIREGAFMNIPAELLFERPWKMLAAVTLRAAQNGDHVLAIKIFGFMYFWGTLISPHMSHADMFDVLLLKSPPPIEAEIAAIAFISLLLLPAEQVIFSNGTESVTVGQLTWAAANVLVHAAEKGIPVDDVALATAKSYFA